MVASFVCGWSYDGEKNEFACGKYIIIYGTRYNANYLIKH